MLMTMKNLFELSIITKYILSFVTPLIIFLAFGEKFINFAKKFKSDAREYTPENHKSKNNTPKIGGVLILATTIISVLNFADFSHLDIYLLVSCLVSFGAIGFWDDWSKIKYKKGISESKKFIAQFVISFILMSIWYITTNTPLTIEIPFINLSIYLGLFIILWGIFILTGVSNSVNLTDGLDGLAINSLIPNFILFTFVSAHTPFVSENIPILCFALLGSSLGFLYYNKYPAKIFMGDVGSLPLGAILGFIAIMCRQEILLAISGTIFVIETISVIIQVIYFKKYKKRFFLRAPLHHHFELKGYNEYQVTKLFTIISYILCFISLIIFKIR